MPFIALIKVSPSAFPFVFFERLVNEMQAVIGTHPVEVGTKAGCFLEGRDTSLVERRTVGGRIRAGRVDAEHLVAHGVDIVVVRQIGGADDLDAGIAESALG